MSIDSESLCSKVLRGTGRGETDGILGSETLAYLCRLGACEELSVSDPLSLLGLA